MKVSSLNTSSFYPSITSNGIKNTRRLLTSFGFKRNEYVLMVSGEEWEYNYRGLRKFAFLYYNPLIELKIMKRTFYIMKFEERLNLVKYLRESYV